MRRPVPSSISELAEDDAAHARWHAGLESAKSADANVNGDAQMACWHPAQRRNRSGLIVGQDSCQHRIGSTGTINAISPAMNFQTARTDQTVAGR